MSRLDSFGVRRGTRTPPFLRAAGDPRLEELVLPVVRNTLRAPALQNVNNTQALQCTTTLEIPEDMDGPIFVYYELQGFYQNHRRCGKQRGNLCCRPQGCHPARALVLGRPINAVALMLQPC